LRWAADPAAASYDVWVSELGANPQTVYIENGVTSNQISVPSNLNFQQHRFWVRSADAAGAKSPWSIGRVFSVTNDKPASLTAQAVTGTSANFQWSAVPGAESYTVWISQQGSRVQLINNVAGTTYAANSLATGAAHTFWVRAVSNDHTQSSWSAAQSFQTTGTAITSQRPVGVNPGTIQNPTTAKLSWGSFSGAASFRVWLNESNGTNVFIVDDVKNAEYWAEGLEPGNPTAIGCRPWMLPVAHRCGALPSTFPFPRQNVPSRFTSPNRRSMWIPTLKAIHLAAVRT